MVQNKWQKLHILNDRNLGLSALLCEVCSRVVVVCHGFTGSKEGGGRALDMGEQLSNLEFSTLLFDFSGCGESEGCFEDISLSGQVGDLGCVVSWCQNNGFNEIILTGRSFGGSTALAYASNDRNIKALCTWAAVARPAKLFKSFINNHSEPPSGNLVAIEGEGEILYLKKDFFSDLENHDLLKYASRIAPRHYLIIHGSKDQSVPVEDAHLLYDSAKHPKKLAIIEGADHRFTGKIEEVWTVFFDWLEGLSKC
ncbi:MAG: alpha/beta hydrolase [Bacillota bacterium]